MAITAKQLTSTLAADGTLTMQLAEQALPTPTGHQVLVKVEAAPINPSDLGLLFGAADVAGADFSGGRIVAQMPQAAMGVMAARVGMAMPVGNECAGTVIEAGDAAEAQALIGKRVACLPGGAFASHVLTDARGCMPVPDAISAEQAAACFVNPLTAQGFVVLN